MSDAPRRVLYLVDGTSQLFRAYFAIRGLSTAQGLPTNAVYGFTTMLRKLLKDESPRYAAVAFDLAGPTFRHDRFEGYKANRVAPPDDLNLQVPYAKQVCCALRIPVIELAGYEADDLIATYCRLGREAGFEVVIVASDKDLLQLVGEGVTVLNPVKNLRLDAGGVEQSFGVAPERVRDVLGLMGDSVDNIPGVPGVGEKTALCMVQVYGDLDSVVARAERFAAAYDAKEGLLRALSALETPDALGHEVAARVCSAGVVLADALRTLRAVEADLEARSRLEEVESALARAGLDRIGDRVGELCRVISKELRDVRRALQGMDKSSSRRAWYAVREHAEAARLSRELATLDDRVPTPLEVESLEIEPVDRPLARALFEALEFRALAAEFGPQGDSGGRQEPGSDADAGPEAAVSQTVVHQVLDRSGLADLARTLGEAGRFALEVEAHGPDPLVSRLDELAVCSAEGIVHVVPLGGPPGGVGDGLPARELAEVLGPTLADPEIGKLGHRIKDVLHVLGRHGMRVEGLELDLEVAAFLLDPDRTDLGIERLAELHLGRRPARQEALVGAGARQRAMGPAGFEPIVPRVAEHADLILRLAPTLERLLEKEDLVRVYRGIDGPLLPVLARMEARGIRIDPALLARMSEEMEVSLDAARREIHELAGGAFNVDSPKQLREVLFDRLGLSPRRKTAKSGVDSTDAATLEDMAEEHEIASRILAYREMAKLKGTYVDSLPQMVRPETGRVHTSYHATGAATGRLSSSDPNLQNIPVRTEAGRRIRSAFVPDPGYVFLASDYSQVELRVLAHLCGDPELTEAFRAGEDIHRHTAARVFGVVPDLVTGLMRHRAKVVNFGVLYGMSETRLARETGMNRLEARRFIHAYFDRFGAVRAYIDRTRAEARRTGTVRTLFGRIRRFPQLAGRPGRAAEEAALRAAVNTTIQGTAADLMKLAMLRADRAIVQSALDVRMLLQVHDELLFEVREDHLDEARTLVRSAMEDVHPLSVPLAVDQKVGKSWLEAT